MWTLNVVSAKDHLGSYKFPPRLNDKLATVWRIRSWFLRVEILKRALLLVVLKTNVRNRVAVKLKHI
ncbi:hypothetical protein K1719_003999 [Acacia pycnantha]|nr:hypothetical protein K1719_003999 [Acacia pycnantha]